MAVCFGAAQAQQGNNNHDNQGAQDRGNNARGDQGRGNDNRGNDARGNNGRGNQDFHFQDQHRQQFQAHYQRDASRWRSHPQDRPRFERGQRIPPDYRIQPVPMTYYRGAPPPPPGYRYGYYDGYVVAYNPATRIIGDVLDLVNAASH
jgi:Ni/Co efflux regulator RcnB